MIQPFGIDAESRSETGPRPKGPEYVGLLNESINFYNLRHFVLPGITE